MDNGARSSAPAIGALHVAENIGEDMLHELGDAFTAVQLGGKPRVASRLVRIANIDADLAAAEHRSPMYLHHIAARLFLRRVGGRPLALSPCAPLGN